MTHPTTRSYPRDMDTAFRHLTPNYACALTRPKRGFPWAKAIAVVSLITLITLPAFANDKPPKPPSCTAGESWRGNDKTDHILIGTTVSFATTLGTKSPWTGFAAGAALGLLKEATDKSGGGCSSSKDLAVTLAGAAVGAFLGKQVLIYQDKKATIVAYRTEF